MTSDPLKTVAVTVPEFVWGRLATIAEHRKVPVADLIGDAIWQILDRDPNRLAELEMDIKKRKRDRKLIR